MKITRIYTGADRQSHFEDFEIPLLPASYGVQSEPVPVTGVIFREAPVGGALDFHPAPRRQFVVTLSGIGEIECGDGTRRRFGPGAVMLAEDTTGQGHITREIGGSRTGIFIPVPEDFDISKWQLKSSTARDPDEGLDRQSRTAAMSMWRIYPLDVGDCEMDRSEALLRRGMGQKVHTKFIAWYLTDGNRKILVDTGLPDEAFARQWHPYNDPRVAPSQQMENALAARGARPEEIDLVVWTHLHWDHAGKPELFSKAEFLVSREELRYAIAPCPIHYVAYEAVQLGLEPTFLKVLPRTRAIDMVEQEILPGLRIMPTPGHSIGSVSLVVSTTAGPYVLTGDAVVCFENFAGDPTRKLPYIPTGIFSDLLAMWDSMARIDAAAGFQKDHILPGHEAQVFKHSCYPPEPPTGGAR